MNYRTPPAPIRRYLSHLHTSAVHSHAVIDQAYWPDLGWCDVLHMPLPTRSAVNVLQARGATSIAISYTRPRSGGRRARADFTVSECLADV